MAEFWMALRIPLPVGVVLGLVLASFFLGGAVYSDEHGLFGQVSAAWVQAIGSIAAIVAATFIASRQSREAMDREERALAATERRDQEILKARRSGVVGLGDSIMQLTSNAVTRLHAGGSEQLRGLPGTPFTLLRSVQENLAAFPIETLESSEGAAALMKVRILVPELVIVMNALVEAANENDEERFLDLRTQFVRFVGQLRGENTRLREALGFSSVEVVV
jgi:hypothetical protein